MISRRKWLQQATGFSALALTSFAADGFNPKPKGFRIGACDWSLGLSSDLKAFDVARDIGLDGLMVNMGNAQNDLHLRRKEVQESFISASRHTGVKISSIAIGELNQVPYKSDSRTDQWVWDSVGTAKNLGVSVVLLAFFAKNDLRNDPAGIREVTRKLKEVTPHAEKEGIVLGIESYLSAAEHLDIIQKVGSPALKVYYDFRNTTDAGYDSRKEFTAIGKDLICELHMKENGFLLGSGTLDWDAIARTVYETRFWGDGWMQIEWSKPDNADLVSSYRSNLSFLKQRFSQSLST